MTLISFPYTNPTNPIPFRNLVEDAISKDLASIQYQSVLGTNANSNMPRLAVFARNRALLDCNGYSLVLCSNDVHYESVDH